METRLVGRSRELGLGREALEALRAGRGGVLVVTGDAGIGKRRLLNELRELAERDGSCWLEGRCVSYGESLPYWPFRDLLRGEWIGAGVDEPELRVRVGLRRRLEQLFASQADELYPYLGGLLEVALEHEAAARTSQLSPEALQWRTFEVVGQLFSRLAEESAPLVLAFEDLHWADATSVQLLEQLLSLAEDAPVLLVLSLRPERDHPAWSLREHAAREFPHLLREIDLGPLGDADGELLAALVAPATLPAELERRVLEAADGNPFFLEELVRSLADVGALVRIDEGWRFDHAVEVEVPPTVEKAILARLDRLSAPARELVTAASALGRTFALPLLEGVLGEIARRCAPRAAAARPAAPEPPLAAAGVPLPPRADPGDGVSHAARRAADAPSSARGGVARGAVRGPRRRGARPARVPLAAGRGRGEGRRLPPARGRQGAARVRARRGDRALPRPAAAARAARRAPGDRARPVQARARAPHVASLRRGERGVPARVRALDAARAARGDRAPAAWRRASFRTDFDPKSAIAWPNIQTCMQLFDRLVEAWPERTIVPSLAERWEISDDGLRYVFHLREGLTWSDGTPLTAHDVEFGIKRVLDPESPGSSVAIYFALENGEETYLGHNTDWDAVGVRALDDRTVEFRLAAPAPYFMSVMNRPDGGPQPRHAIEGVAEARVVSGAFEVAERTDERLVLRRRSERPGNVAEVEL